MVTSSIEKQAEFFQCIKSVSQDKKVRVRFVEEVMVNERNDVLHPCIDIRETKAPSSQRTTRRGLRRNETGAAGQGTQLHQVCKDENKETKCTSTVPFDF